MQMVMGYLPVEKTSDSITSNSITVNGYISTANAAYISSGTTLTLKGTSVKLTNALKPKYNKLQQHGDITRHVC